MKEKTRKKTDTYHHGNLKEALITTTLELICEEDISKVTMRELATRLGTSRTALYRHFASKEALIQAAVKSGFDRLGEAFLAVYQDGEIDTVERIRRLGLAYLHFGMQNTALFRVLFGRKVMVEREEACDRDGVFNPEEASDSDAFLILVALVKQAQDEGLFKHEDATLQSMVIWSMIHGLTVLIIDGHLFLQENVDTIFAMGFNTILEGIRR